MTPGDPAAELFKAEVEHFWEFEAPADLQRILSDHAARGIASGGAVSEALREFVGDGLWRLLDRRLQLERRVVEAGGRPLNADRLAAVNAEIDTFVNEFVHQASARMPELIPPDLHAEVADPDLLKIRPFGSSDDLDRVIKLVKDRSKAELAMLAEESKRLRERRPDKGRIGSRTQVVNPDEPKEKKGRFSPGPAIGGGPVGGIGGATKEWGDDRVSEQYGKWKVVKSIGEGGQARVFRVTDSSGVSSEDRVLKRLKNVDNAERRERFKREIEATQAIEHPNVLRILDHDLTADQPYYVAELCEGGSLEDCGAKRFKADVEAAVEVLRPIVDALIAAHQSGVIHRDVKPANILFRKDGAPVIGDFGICHMEGGHQVTLSDQGIGSRNYIAPEMESGRHHLGPPSDRTDVYSLGKVLYWMISGGRIFAREDHRSNSLVELLGDQRFEHVHGLLDRMVLENPKSRDPMPAVGERLKQVARLVRDNFAPLCLSLGIQCRFCGIGRYDRYPTLPGQAVPELGLSPVIGSDVRVLHCTHCGHVELFQFVKKPGGKIEEEIWWER